MTNIFGTPTIYRCIKFRSKLEANWAKFFDEESIVWRYEPATFYFEHGRRYTPDFRLDHLDHSGLDNVYVEVKPTFEAANSVQSTNYNNVIELWGDMVLCIGEPDYENMKQWDPSILFGRGGIPRGKL